MSTLTTHYSLVKPTLAEYALITVINGNMDLLDTALYGLAIPLCKYNATSDPTVGDDSADGYIIDSNWWNVTTHKLFIAESVALGAAVWRQVYPCDGGNAATLGGIAAGGFALVAKGVTNGDSHDHNGGDGAQIDHGGLGGLADDDHSAYATLTNYKIRHIEFVIDGGGAAIVSGIKGDIRVGYACTIKKATLLARTSGSIVVNIWKCTYTQYDDSTHPVVGDKITSSTPPTITSAVKSKDITLTSWITAIAADSVLRFNVDSCTSITRCTVDLEVEVTR